MTIENKMISFMLIRTSWVHSCLPTFKEWITFHILSWYTWNRLYTLDCWNSHDRYIFSQGYSLYFFLVFAHLLWFWVWGFVVGDLFWVFEVGVLVDGVWGLWCGAFWVFWVGGLYINVKEKPWYKMVRHDHIIAWMITKVTPTCILIVVWNYLPL